MELRPRPGLKPTDILEQKKMDFCSFDEFLSMLYEVRINRHKNTYQENREIRELLSKEEERYVSSLPQSREEKQRSFTDRNQEAAKDLARRRSYAIKRKAEIRASVEDYLKNHAVIKLRPGPKPK